MFSVIIPIYNKLPHLDRSINSVLNQTFKEFELILVDDASTDGSSEKISDYKDSRIKILKRDTPGPGGYAARNLGITNAKYEWVAFLDADDEWNKNYLYEREIAIQKHGKVEVISSKWIYSKDNKLMQVRGFNKIKPLYSAFSLVDYFNNNLIIWTSAVTIRKSLLIKAGLFPAGKCKRGGDMDTWIRCLYNSAGNLFINKQLAIYYRDTVNRVTDNSKNPSSKICCQETIEAIKVETQDEKLSSAIDLFYAKFVSSLMIRTLRTSGSIDKSNLFTIRSNRIKIAVLTKIYLYKILLVLKIR